MMEAS
jgi:hypothetical protein